LDATLIEAFISVCKGDTASGIRGFTYTNKQFHTQVNIVQDAFLGMAKV